MQKILKTFLLGLVFGLGFFIIGGIGYFLLKARQPTNPNIADSNPTSLYVTNNETLSAAKWNTLTDKVNTKTFYVCTNADSSTPCAEAKSNGGQGTTNYRAINCSRSTTSLAYGDIMMYSSSRRQFRNGDGVWLDCNNGSVVVMNLNK